ncbi:uncharacterized protein LOC143284905 [Babylonia areolata]|uniref:uncharacterized protein LOC143284905 n=1 Tax=Babylonia areolata TaxID=304850 RepID=UPI003FD2E53E
MLEPGSMASITYEVSKFNPKPNSELLCAICLNVLHEARMCPCHHIFCELCIRRWLESNPTCPTCRSPSTLHLLRAAPPLVLNVLNSLTMDCDYKEAGCDKSIAKENFPSHIENCDFRPVSCPHQGCSLKTTAFDLQAHTEECQYRSVECPKKCQLQFPACELENHDCFASLQMKVKDLERDLYRHQAVMHWISTKLNAAHLPGQSIREQLEIFNALTTALNQCWPEIQSFSSRLLSGSDSASSAPISRRQSCSLGTRGHTTENENANSALDELVAEAEQWVSEANNSQNSRRVFGPRDPGGADGPTVHIARDASVRGEVDGEGADIMNVYRYVSSDESETWDGSSDPSYTGFFVEGNAGDHLHNEDHTAAHQYQPLDPAVSNRSRTHWNSDEATRGYDTGADQQAHNLGQHLERSLNQDRMLASVLEALQRTQATHDYLTGQLSVSAPHSHQYQSSSYSGQENTDYSNWIYANFQTDYISHHAEPRSRSRSRSRSNSPPNTDNHERYSRSRSSSSREQYSPSRSPSESYRSCSSENSGRLSRSQSRSTSTIRGRSSSRSPEHARAESSQSYGSSNHTHEDLTDNNDWIRSDDGLDNGSPEHHNYWAPNWHSGDEGSNHDHWSSPGGDLGEALDEYESVTPMQCPSHTQEQSRQASTSTYCPYDEDQSQDGGSFSEVSADRHQSRHSVDADYQQTPDYTHSDNSRGFQERGLSSDMSDVNEGARLPNHSPGDVTDHQTQWEECALPHAIPSETPAGQDSTSDEDSHLQSIRTENTASGSRISEKRLGDSYCDYWKQDAVRPLPRSYKEDENSALDKKSEVDHKRLSNDRGGKKKLCPETSRNVWESSSDTTSLDYEIPADDSTPKPGSQLDSDAECNSPNFNAEHSGDGIVAETDNVSDKGSVCDDESAHRTGSTGSISRTNHNDDSSRDKSADSDSEENIAHHETKQRRKASPSGKRKALHRKPSKTPPDHSSSDSDTSEDSDSNVCFKRRMKVRSLDSSSNSEVSSRETETWINQVYEDKDSRQSSMPSTSHSPSKSVNLKSGKGTRKQKGGSHKQKLKSPSSKTKMKNESSMALKEGKEEKSKSGNHSPAKKARHGSSLSHKESGSAMPNGNNKKSRKVGHAVSHFDIQASNPSAPMSSRSSLPTNHHGNEACVWKRWSTESPRKSTRSHTFSRADVLERTGNVTENLGTTNNGTTNSRGGRHSLAAETEGRRGSERRVVESDMTRRVEDSSGPHAQGVSAGGQGGENAQVYNSGRRTMQVGNMRNRIETRRRSSEENTRTVLIADLPVPPTTLQLLDQYNNSDESDSTWSPSSSKTESSSPV